MMPPTSIDGTDITGATIDGTDVTEITVDGDTVFTAGPPTGSFMVVSDRNSGDVFMFDLASPFDLSGTGSATSSYREGGDLRGCGISPDGTKVYTADIGGDIVTQRILSTPFDLTSQSFDTSFNSTLATDISFPQGGNKLYVTNEPDSLIDQYDLATPFDISTRSNKETESFPFKCDGMSVVDSGNKLFVNELAGRGLNRYDLTTPFDITTKTNRTSVIFTSDDQRAFCMNESGTSFITDNRDADKIQQFVLSTPYDINTISFDDEINAPTSDSIGVGLNGIS